MEQSSSPVGENKPDGDRGHNPVSQCKTEIQHLLLPYNSLLIFTVKLLQSIILCDFMSRHKIFVVAVVRRSKSTLNPLNKVLAEISGE